MDKLFWCALACLWIGCTGLKMTLDLSSTFLSETRAVLTCVESITSMDTNSTQVHNGFSNVPDEQVATISSLEVFKVDTSADSIGNDQKRDLLASVTPQQPHLTHTSNGIKVDGHLEAGRATLLLEFAKREDCQAEYICEACSIDSQGREHVRTSHILQSPETSRDDKNDMSWTPIVAMQILTLLQKLDTKMAIMSSALERDGVDPPRSDLGSKADLLEEKIKSIGEDLSIHSDRLEGRIESFNKDTNDGIDSLTDKIESLKYRLEDNIKSVQNRIKDDLNELSHDIDIKTNCTVSEELKSAVAEVLTPKNCYKGIVSVVSSTPYIVIQPGPDNALEFPVLCDTFTDRGGWFVFQRRTKGDVSFYRDWDNYKNGFGSMDGDFWLGNDKLHALTSSGTFELRIDIRYNGNSAFAQYETFFVGDEISNYVMKVGHYHGTAGDSLARHNGMQFSTYDRDNDKYGSNCASMYNGAWWYVDCHHSNLNGQWMAGANRGPRWHTFSGVNAVSYTEMKIRRVISKL